MFQNLDYRSVLLIYELRNFQVNEWFIFLIIGENEIILIMIYFDMCIYFNWIWVMFFYLDLVNDY